MKNRSLCFLGAVLFSPALVFAQFPGSVSPVTFSLTFAYSAPGTLAKDENGKPIKGEPAFSTNWTITNDAKKTSVETSEVVSKMVTQKYGNKELLLDLIEEEILPQYGSEPYLAGWSIVSAYSTIQSESNVYTGDSRLYAIHKTEGDIVDLTNYVATFPAGNDYADKGSFKSVKTTDFSDAENPVTEEVVTSDFSWRETEALLIDFDTIPFFYEDGFTGFVSAQGILNAAAKRGKIGADKLPVVIAKAAKITAISGEGPILDEVYQDRSVVEGSITYGAGKATEDVSDYPNILPQ